MSEKKEVINNIDLEEFKISKISNTLPVSIRLLTKKDNLEEVEYIGENGDIKKTKKLYFKKIKVKNLLDDELNEILDLKDLIGKGLSELREKHLKEIKYDEEEINKLQKLFTEIKEKEEKATDLEKQEIKVNNILSIMQNYEEIGLSSYKVNKICSKIAKKYIFLDVKGSIPLKEEVIDQLDFDITNVYFFLLALSI